MCSGILQERTVSAVPLHLRDVQWSQRDRMPYLYITSSPAELSVPGSVHWWVVHGAGCMHTLFTHLSTLRVPYQLHILCSWPSSAEWRMPCHLCWGVRTRYVKQLLYKLNNVHTYIYIYIHTHLWEYIYIILVSEEVSIVFSCQQYVTFKGNTTLDKVSLKWLRWSRGSMLPLSTQVRKFKPGRSRQDFSGRKNPQHAFLRKGSKAVGPVS